MASRAVARHALTAGPPGTVVVASVRAVVQRVSPSPVEPQVVRAGETIDFGALVASLGATGYDRTDRVESRGEYAVRGGIIDLYPAQGREAVRVDFWGDQVEEITGIDIGTQRSSGERSSVVAYPAREVRPDRVLAETARALLAAEPWAASTWDRIADGMSFPGIESWLPWLAPARTARSTRPARRPSSWCSSPYRAPGPGRRPGPRGGRAGGGARPHLGRRSARRRRAPGAVSPVRGIAPRRSDARGAGGGGALPGRMRWRSAASTPSPAMPSRWRRGIGRLIEAGLRWWWRWTASAAADRVARGAGGGRGWACAAPQPRRRPSRW